MAGELESAARREDSHGLKRVLGFRDLTFFYIVAALSLRWIATAAAAGPGTLAVWVTALCCFFVPLAFSVMELSTRFPQEGGLYVWTREAFGDGAGFIAGWTYFMANLPYFPSVLYFSAASVLPVMGARGAKLDDDPAYFAVFALVWLAIITLVNIRSAVAGKWLNNVASFGSWLPIVALLVLGAVAYAHHGSATHFTASAMVPRPTLKNAIFLSTIFFAFGGCEAASFMGEEIRDARRTIPRALLASGVVLAVCYILGTVALLVALPSSVISGVNGLAHGVHVLCAESGVPWLEKILGILIGLGAVGGAAAFLSSVARLPFVAGIDRYLPRPFGWVHKRYRTPWVAIACYGLAGMVMTVLSQAGTTVRGAYDVLLSMTVITYFIPYLYLFASMIKLQRRPAGEGVMRVPGGAKVAIPLAALGFVSTAVTIALSLVPSQATPNKTLAVAKVLIATVVLVGSGVVVYWAQRRKHVEAATSVGE
jgi:glutamate:GABA antiporter